MWSSSISMALPFAFLSSLSNQHHVRIPLRHGESSQQICTTLTTSNLPNSIHRVCTQHQHLHLRSHKIDSQIYDGTKSNDINSKINVEKDYSIIRQGQIYMEHNFITSSDIAALQEDIAQLKDSLKFQPSGLSNRVPGDQNIFGASDRLTCTITSDLIEGNDQYSYIRSAVEDKLKLLKRDLEISLSPSHANSSINGDELIEIEMGLELELAEMYYSISPKSSHLPRHNDERHEDTKGDKGWMYDTRRSISWLIYLNGEDWESGAPIVKSDGANCEESTYSGSGGELRAYCRNCRSSLQCGSHDGNIQIGWLRLPDLRAKENENVDDIHGKAEFEPIFLDSWVKAPTPIDELEPDEDYDGDEFEGLKWRSMSALYRVKDQSYEKLNSKPESKPDPQNHDCEDYYQHYQQRYSQREYLSKAFGPDCPSWPSEINLEPSEFMKVLASQLSNEDLRSRFIGTEVIHDPDIKVVDVVPRGGTLVLFDSVVVPHEVLEVMSGERLAIAGWLHELQQPFPNWYGT